MAKTSFVAEVALRRNLLTFSSTVCIEKYYKLFFQENKKGFKESMGRYKVNCGQYKTLEPILEPFY